MSEMSNLVRLKLPGPDGTDRIIEVDEQEIFAAMATSGIPTEATISVRESRQRYQYASFERFVSVKLDFTRAAKVVNAIQDPEAALRISRKMIHLVEGTCLRVESHVVNWVEMMFGKSGLAQHLRDPNNPWVMGGNSFSEGARLAGVSVMESEKGRKS